MAVVGHGRTGPTRTDHHNFRLLRQSCLRPVLPGVIGIRITRRQPIRCIRYLFSHDDLLRHLRNINEHPTDGPWHEAADALGPAELRKNTHHKCSRSTPIVTPHMDQEVQRDPNTALNCHLRLLESFHCATNRSILVFLERFSRYRILPNDSFSSSSSKGQQPWIEDEDDDDELFASVSPRSGLIR